MSWAAGRRFIIITVVVAVGIALLAFIFGATVYETPSCSDTKQNQGEAGVDCGGPCATYCASQVSAPIVRFTKSIPVTSARTDIIAYVDNPNAYVGSHTVPYTITLYSSSHSVLKESTGVLDLPPFSTVPIFLPSFYIGEVSGGQAFLTINSEKIIWRRMPERTLPVSENPVVGGTTNEPRITAVLKNETVNTFSNVKVIVAVYGPSGNVIAASQTIVSQILGQGESIATFTWNQPFSEIPARIEVTPLFPLSS